MPLPTLVLGLAAATAVRPQAGADALPAADPAVTRAELEHHVRFLAADELGGRAPLTAGMERAAQYLARALAAAGVEPAGENGTFFQSTGLKRYEYPAAPRLVFTRESGEEVEARHGVDFTLRMRGAARSTEKLPLRFYYDYNHARMPLTGNPAEAIYLSGGKPEKQRILNEKGIEDLEDWGLEIELNSSAKAREPGGAREAPPARLSEGEEAGGCELIELRGPLLDDFERRRFTHVQLLIEEVPAPYEDRNVVGRIRGAGTSAAPELAREVVILSAHYDHLGIRPTPRGREREDALFNGADDNASGCAALLELAQALARGTPPARTLVILFTTGEESGGYGIQRYLRAPAEPLAATVANLNLEMLGRPDELVGGAGKLWLTGFECSNLGPAWQGAGLAIVADPRPDQSFFSRSDNFPLALEGVVAQSLSSFGMHRDYHRPRDEADTLDYVHLEAAARIALGAATTLADGSLRPAWVPEKQPRKDEMPGRKKRAERAGRDGGREQDDDGEEGG